MSSIKNHIDKKIIIRLRILLFLLLAMTIFLFHELNKEISYLPIALMGIFVGYILGRLFFIRSRKFVWNETSLKLITTIDWYGFIVLIIYLLFFFGKNWFFGHWFHDLKLVVITLSLSIGIKIGRILGTRSQVRKAFKLIITQKFQ